MFHSSPILRALRRVLEGAIEMRWRFALLVTLLHAMSAYLGLMLLDQQHLVSSPAEFTYFYVVTGSSVGYGDLSPSSTSAKLFSALWVIPGALSLFGLLLGKVIASASHTMRKIMNGFGNFAGKTGHIVVLGHVQGQTEKLLDETRRLHGNRDVVIVATGDLSGGQDGWSFIRATSLSQRSDIERAGIKGADFIVILGRDDDESMAACLAVSCLAPQGHVVAYFRYDSAAELVRAKCDGIEIVTSTSIEQVARALSDPGAGQVLHNLASTRVGATLASLTFRGAVSVTAGELGAWLRRTHRATLMGFCPSGQSQPLMDFGDDDLIMEGQTIFYVAGTRLPDDLSYQGASKRRAA